MLDKETGLVWEQTPANSVLDWGAAALSCYDAQVGDRKGWRLPSIEELMNLAVPSQTPALPTAHPFDGVVAGPQDAYWSSTTHPGDAERALGVAFGRNGVLAVPSKTFADCTSGASAADRARTRISRRGRPT